MGKDSSAIVPTSSDKPAEEAKHPEVIEKEKNANQGVASDALKLPTVTQDPHTEKEAPKKMEIIWPFFLYLPRLIQQTKAPNPQKQPSLNLSMVLPKTKL